MAVAVAVVVEKFEERGRKESEFFSLPSSSSSRPGKGGKAIPSSSSSASNETRG